MTNVRQDAILGVVFFAAVGLLLAVTLLLTNFSFGDRPEIEVRFANAAGLEKGDAVFVLGRRAGEVATVAPRAGPRDERIGVVLRFDEPLALRSDATIEIVEASLLGGKRIEIEPGVADAPLAAGGPLRGTVRKTALDALSDEMQGEDGLVGRVKTTFGRINEGQGTLAQFLNSPKLHDAILTAVESLTASLDAIKQGRSVIGRLVHDPGLGDDVAATVQSIRSVTQKIDTGDGPLGVAINDTTLASNMRTIGSDIALMTRELREGQGTVGLLLRDPDTRTRVQTIVADIGELTGKARNPEAGLLGALFSDTQLVADARGILTSFREFADRAVNGNGMLARLVNDPEWGRRFGQILGQVQRAIEDAREAAPVGTFFQVLTGFF